MRAINEIILHCSATPPTMDIGVAEIKRWHTDPPPKGRGWNDIGYHFVVRRNGGIENGRPVATPGAHTQGHNANSIGICLVGGTDKNGKTEDNFTPMQMQTTERLVRVLKVEYNKATVHGHREFASKDCPSFDVQEWIKQRGI